MSACGLLDLSIGFMSFVIVSDYCSKLSVASLNGSRFRRTQDSQVTLIMGDEPPSKDDEKKEKKEKKKEQTDEKYEKGKKGKSVGTLNKETKVDGVQKKFKKKPAAK